MDEGIAVSVHSTDILSRAGALSQLKDQTGLTVIEPTTQHVDNAVAVVLTHGVDDSVMVELRRLVREWARRVVLVTDQLHGPELVNILECGVRFILWRHEATQARLIKAVRAAASGESALPSDLLGQLMTHVGRMNRAQAFAPSFTMSPLDLTSRELDVLRLLAEGLDTRQIAEKLTYSERTIKNDLYALMSRLHLRNRAHAVAFALRKGYI